MKRYIVAVVALAGAVALSLPGQVSAVFSDVIGRAAAATTNSYGGDANPAIQCADYNGDFAAQFKKNADGTYTLHVEETIGTSDPKGNPLTNVAKCGNVTYTLYYLTSDGVLHLNSKVSQSGTGPLVWNVTLPAASWEAADGPPQCTNSTPPTTVLPIPTTTTTVPPAQVPATCVYLTTLASLSGGDTVQPDRAPDSDSVSVVDDGAVGGSIH
jgi:hypothetical protein